MIKQLTPDVFYGDAAAIHEVERLGIKAVVNVAHRINERYNYNPLDLPRTVLYVRFPRKDREEWDAGYIVTLISLFEAIHKSGQLPVLCHCQMGGHRGPSSAALMAWVIAGKKWSAADVALCGAFSKGFPNTMGGRGKYYLQVKATMERLSV